jgi:hypothetical protein
MLANDIWYLKSLSIRRQPLARGSTSNGIEDGIEIHLLGFGTIVATLLSLMILRVSPSY